MAEVKIAIAKTPKQAEKIGKTVTKKYTITEDDAEKLRDYYRDIEASRITVMALIGLAAPVFDIYFKASMSTFLGTVSGSLGLLKSYFGKLGDSFEDIVDESATSREVTFVFKYKRVGSNDGFYWLTDVY